MRLICPAGQEASTWVAIWYDQEAKDINVALVSALPVVPETAAVFTVADLMERGMVQRADAESVTMAGESQN